MFLWLDSLAGRTGFHSEVWYAVSGLWLFRVILEYMQLLSFPDMVCKILYIVFPFWGVIRYNISYWFWNRFYSASKHLSEKPWTNHRKMWSCGTWSARISIAIGLWRVFFLVKVLLKVVLSMGNKQCRSRLLGSFLHWFSVQLNIRKTLAWAISL